MSVDKEKLPVLPTLLSLPIKFRRAVGDEAKHVKDVHVAGLAIARWLGDFRSLATSATQKCTGTTERPSGLLQVIAEPQRYDFVRMTRLRISVMSSIANRMPSRPRPLSLTPP